MRRARGSTHYLNGTGSERVEHILGAALAWLHVLGEAGRCVEGGLVEGLRCRLGAWLASEDEAGVRVAGRGVGVGGLSSHLWR